MASDAVNMDSPLVNAAGAAFALNSDTVISQMTKKLGDKAQGPEARDKHEITAELLAYLRACLKMAVQDEHQDEVKWRKHASVCLDKWRGVSNDEQLKEWYDTECDVALEMENKYRDGNRGLDARSDLMNSLFALLCEIVDELDVEMEKLEKWLVESSGDKYSDTEPNGLWAPIHIEYAMGTFKEEAGISTFGFLGRMFIDDLRSGSLERIGQDNVEEMQAEIEEVTKAFDIWKIAEKLLSDLDHYI